MASGLRQLNAKFVVESRDTPAVRAANVWVMVVNKWNDPNFFPVISMKLDTHLAVPKQFIVHLKHSVTCNLQPQRIGRRSGT